MKTILIAIFILGTAFVSNMDISMLDIKIGDPAKALSKITLKKKAEEDNMVKYATANGNDFSVTQEDGKIVFMENDWLQNPNNNQPLFSDFKFGQTTLSDIRKKFSTNGFTYKSRRPITTEKNLIEFNCFEFDSPNNEVLVTITKMSLKEDMGGKNVADKLKLDAIIITTKNYLDKSWGKEKIFDSNYKKIQF